MEYLDGYVIASFDGAGCSFVNISSKNTLDSYLLMPDASTVWSSQNWARDRSPMHDGAV